MLKHRYDGRPLGREAVDFSKLRVGSTAIEDPLLLLNANVHQIINSNFGNKQFVLQQIYNKNKDILREISHYFYDCNGIYEGLCRYAATLYRYDWYVTPYVQKDFEDENEKKLLKDFSNTLFFLDKSEIKQTFTNIALQVIVDGVFYGIIMDFGDKVGIQQLPAKYCRCRFYSSTLAGVELNLEFFKSHFTNIQQRLQVLKLFPIEVQKAYVAYCSGKLKGDYPGQYGYWYALDPATTVRLTVNDNELPFFMNVIPQLLDLDEAQELDKKRLMQQLLKIIVQKLPLDKNGDLIFDMEEAQDAHKNAVQMLKRAIGVDVLTTFADITKIDTKDASSSVTRDDLERVERSVYNSSTVSRNLFNAEGNLATTNSILADESSLRVLPLMFQQLLNRLIEKFSRKGHYDFRAEILHTTQFNYQALAKLYKEQAQMGVNLLLPQIALGQSQSNIIASISFQNKVLNLAELMKPPMLSSTQSAKNLGGSNQTNQNRNQSEQKETTITETKETGRPAKDDNEKSEKTLQNIEALS